MPSPVDLAVQSYLTCPDRISIGIESSQAPTTPVIAFVPPGPVVTQRRAILSFIRA